MIQLVLVSLIASALVVAAAPRTVEAAGCRLEFWVSPYGNDFAEGDRTHPFRTLQRARDVVRAVKDATSCDLVVNLRGGDHRLERPLVLDWHDSGVDGKEVIYRSEPGERAVISGSVRVTGWTLHDPGLGIYRAFVGPRRSRQLYVDGVRATRARTESYPDHFERTPGGYRFIKPGATLPVVTNVTDVEAVTITQWKMMRCPVQAVLGRDITMQNPCWKNANVFLLAPPQQPLWSFQLLTRFENAYAFLDRPGEWYLDSTAGWLYYIPLPGQDLSTAVVELPVLEALVDGQGELERPVAHIRFEGLTFAYATWLGPSGPDGYATDQSGFHLVGEGHEPNIIGHDPNVVRTPGNVRFRYARHLTFVDNEFVHLGAVGLDFDTGSQHNVIVDNRFEDISSAGIQLGGVAREDHHPDRPEQVTRDNRISNNLVQRIGREYVDAAGIMIGFTTRTVVSHNDIFDVPWSGIAIGWGWGLLDPGSFPGLGGAVSGQWGRYTTPTTSRGNRILNNRIRGFLNELWDGGAIYSLGQQGASAEDGELIAGNVASGKRARAGGNIFYTDGGSRYVTLFENVSYDNPTGVSDFGPCGLPSELPLCAIGLSSAAGQCSSLPLCALVVPYGADIGGCIPYGDLRYESNYFGSFTFYEICSDTYPIDVTFVDNHVIRSVAEVPGRILRAAGRQPRP